MTTVDLALIWPPPGAESDAAALAAESAAAFGVPVAAGTPLDGEGPPVVIAAFPEAVDGEEVRAASDGLAATVVLYRRRYTTDPERSGRYRHAPFLFLVRVEPPSQWLEPIRSWLDEEHFDRQTAMMDEIRWSDGFEPLEPPPHFLNLWGIDDPSIVDSPEWVRIRGTEGWEQVRPGFQAADLVRRIYRIIEGG